MANNQNNFDDESGFNEELGHNMFCAYCKEPIYGKEYVKKSKHHFYHIECWNLMHDIYEELDFDDEQQS